MKGFLQYDADLLNCPVCGWAAAVEHVSSYLGNIDFGWVFGTNGSRKEARTCRNMR